MSKKTTIEPVLTSLEEEEVILHTRPARRTFLSLLWPWLLTLLAIGAVIIIVVSSLAGYWLHSVQVPGMVNRNIVTTSMPISTFRIGRTVPYAGLDVTIMSAQYASAFGDDLIHAGSRTLRLNMLIRNRTSMQVNVVYYTIAHLLLPRYNPITPSNVQLAVSPRPGTEVRGWIDFAVPQGVQLRTLVLQLGSAARGEELIKLPLAGRFDMGQYADRIAPQDAVFGYTFAGNNLNYHLTGVEMRYSYQGSQCRAGQRFYIFNFQVDNQNDVAISPGFGFDYVRMVNGYGHPPIASTLPYTFKAGQTAVGRVVFAAPANLHNFAVGFLSQNGTGERDYEVSWDKRTKT
jgi:hypothetical protein